MRIFKGMMSKKAGLSPGTLVHVGERKLEKARISLMNYDENRIEEKELSSVEECLPYKQGSGVTWINIDGLHDLEVINSIGTLFDVHPLILEDIVNTGQRTKMDDLDNYLFIVGKMIYFDKDSDQIKFEQISLILWKNFVVSFQEDVGDVFEQVRERLRKGKGRIRKTGADYLLYSLLDAIVDSYYVVLEKIGERMEEMEEDVITNPAPGILQAIHNTKRDLILLRKSVWPLREITGSLERGEYDLIDEKNSIFFRDVFDHTIQVIDAIETCRDIVTGMMDLFLSGVSNRMNEVMKMLTIIATIFIPLTFIVGLYGMNFEYMPELKWRWGYPAVLITMFIAGLLMLYWFKRKRFL